MTNKEPSPCDGAIQVGSTSDLRAVWERDGILFTVTHDAKGIAYREDVGVEAIARRLDPPKTYEEICSQ